MRFAGLDSDKYGKISLLSQQIRPIIHKGLHWTEKTYCLIVDNNNSSSLIEECVSLWTNC